MAGRLHPFSRPKENPSDLSHRLLACPFCGGEAEVDSYDDRAGTFVQCCNCGAHVSGGEVEWNTRTPAAALSGREAVAWLCVSPDGVQVDATASENTRADYARFGRTITPLYITPQPGGGWVLVPVAKLREILILLDNVTAATDSEADYLGQAENMLNRLAAPSAKGIAP